MNTLISYEKAKCTFEYLGKHYFGDVVCSISDFKTYWFVFDRVEVKPFGGSVEFRIVNGHLECVKEFPAHRLFILCIKKAIDRHRKEQGN